MEATRMGTAETTTAAMGMAMEQAGGNLELGAWIGKHLDSPSCMAFTVFSF
jgi:hypothetical protein